jgi:hypothetical protein
MFCCFFLTECSFIMGLIILSMKLASRYLVKGHMLLVVWLDGWSVISLFYSLILTAWGGGGVM